MTFLVGLADVSIWKCMSACFIAHVACSHQHCRRKSRERTFTGQGTAGLTRDHLQRDTRKDIWQQYWYCQWSKFYTTFSTSALSRFLPSIVWQTMIYGPLSYAHSIHKWHPQGLFLSPTLDVKQSNCRWAGDRKYGRSTGSVRGLNLDVFTMTMTCLSLDLPSLHVARVYLFSDAVKLPAYRDWTDRRHLGTPPLPFLFLVQIPASSKNTVVECGDRRSLRRLQKKISRHLLRLRPWSLIDSLSYQYIM